jgi:hypothetical protein
MFTIADKLYRYLLICRYEREYQKDIQNADSKEHSRKILCSKLYLLIYLFTLAIFP